MGYSTNMTLLISPDAIKTLGVFDRNLNERQISPVIKLVQDSKIQSLIGTRLYERLLEMVEAGEVCDDGNECYAELLNGHLKWILAWLVASRCAVMFYTDIRNAGVITPTDTNFTPVSYETMKKVAADYADNADTYIAQLQRYLTCSCGCFPELREVTRWWEQSADTTNVTDTPFYFPNRKKCCYGI